VWNLLYLSTELSTEGGVYLQICLSSWKDKTVQYRHLIFREERRILILFLVALSTEWVGRTAFNSINDNENSAKITLKIARQSPLR